MRPRNVVRNVGLFILGMVFAAASSWQPMSLAEEVISGRPDTAEAVPAAAKAPIAGIPVEDKGVIVGVPVKEPSKTGAAEKVVEGIVVGAPIEPAVVESVAKPLPPLKGPKKSVAVTRFEDQSGFSEEWAIGEAIADLLTPALMQADRFVVVEREKIKTLLHERDMAVSGRRTKLEFIGASRLVPAQIGVSGTVIEFSSEKKEAGAAAADLRAEGGTVSEAVHVALHLKIRDTFSDMVLFEEIVETKTTYMGVEGDYTDETFGIGGERFPETPLGKATLETIGEAAYRIVLDLEKVPWRGSVILAQAGKVYINCGKREGVVPGQKFVVNSRGEELTDPDTGELLGVEETPAGAISVVVVEEKYSVAKIDQGEDFKRGDVLRLP
jgi:curli biogenesis system outer membrane secretion channel CsgG